MKLEKTPNEEVNKQASTENDIFPTEPTFMENPEVLSERFEKTEEFLEKNRNLVGGIAAGVLVVVAGLFFFYNYKKTQNEEAQKEMFQAVYAFEADSLKKALQGGGTGQGLEAIADEYSGTDAANLAEFYIAVAQLKQGKLDEALEAIGKFSSKDDLLQARAYCITGDIYMEKGSFSEAEANYKKAADLAPNKYLTPNYLLKLGLAQEKQNNFAGAAQTYATVTTKYFDAAEAAEAKKYQARAEQMAQ
ncbi:Tetratricopeptide repeat-containing protein [Flexibacter flexilis DSM 6793]|uniref:Tetratricopeptide repeat-containing protein n=1 Tax=Flexibacter flexilis DSM 6793 TaxID=927664 RepID=A0A1I1EB09_9BACT|nr:tetratricopeptide repeat protein [Flexibacter flexilis]SFB82103.1 Tetratricopeptide repeat-containing protein [Flexibacter flexilis DSM 6793]